MNNQLLEYISKYVQLTAHEQSIVNDKSLHRKYLKGQYIVQQGNICTNESFIIAGSVKSFYVDNEGQEHVVALAIEDWWMADLGSFISQSPSDYNVQCLENTTLIQFSFDKLQQLYIEVPKMERFFRIIIEKAYVASQKRIVDKISLTAKERYLKFKLQHPQIEQRVPQYLIASYLGITKEFLSKIRRQLISDPNY